MSPHEILRCAQDDISPAGCHPFASLRAGSECSEGSGETDAQILRCAQDDMPGPLRMTCRTALKAAKDDMPDRSQARSREAFSPNVQECGRESVSNSRSRRW